MLYCRCFIFLGLFALHIHNCSSPNWFSRTYSSYVSWIENQAVEIGSSALRILNEKWEDILTPSECVQIASRASRSGDSLLKRTAAELALTCLPQSQSLNSRDITQTITMCREQSEEMLERACSSVESAARHGGIQPELLFRIAREWHYLHEERRKREGINIDAETSFSYCIPVVIYFSYLLLIFFKFYLFVKFKVETKATTFLE